MRDRAWLREITRDVTASKSLGYSRFPVAALLRTLQRCLFCRIADLVKTCTKHLRTCQGHRSQVTADEHPLEQLWAVRSTWKRRCCPRHIPCQRTRKRRTISTCFAISSVRRPHLPSSHVALVLWHGCLTDSASAFADNRSWPPREPHAQPQVACGLQTPAVTLLSDQRPRLPRHRRKVR